MKKLEKARQFLKNAEDYIGRVLYPRGASCQICGEYRMADAYTALCPDCMKAMDELRVPASACDRCLFPVRRGKGCAMCSSGRMKHIDRSYAPFCYRMQVRKLIHEFKFEHNASFLHYLADQMGNALTERTFDLIAPVPLHKKRLEDRGLNQAMLLAERLSRRLQIPAKEILQRTVYHKPQSETPLAQRRKNVENAFRCICDLTGKRILLVDDVRTTGSTADACAKVLKMAGAERVCLCTVAVVYRNPKKLITHKKPRKPKRYQRKKL